MPNTRKKLIELLKDSFEEQYSKRGLLTAPHTADLLIANGVTIATDNNVGSKWIPVTERLPQENLDPGELCELVQVLLKDGSVTVGFCNRGMKCWFYMPISETRFMGNHYDMTPVIAWQPLALPPAAPKEN